MNSNVQTSDRRIAKRYKYPLHVNCMGADAVASDWSTGGLKLAQFEGPLPCLGETVNLGLSFKIKNIRVSFETKGEVVRVSPEDKMFAIHFCELNTPEHDMLIEFSKYG